LAGSAVVLADHVQAMDRQQILEAILEKIYRRSIIIKVLDIANFEGSQIQEIYDDVRHKKHRLLIICNKLDALPEGIDP
jgi:ribosome biogenesis GTPase A